MAARSLGTLTLDLVAKIGGFTQGMDAAARSADKRSREIAAAQKRMRQQVEKEWSSLNKVIAGGIAGITIAGIFTKFIQESRDAQNEQAQLAAVLKSTGEAAGFSQEKLNGMAEVLSKSTIFSEGEINRAQTRLLSYTNVVGEQLPKALEALLDMSARTGMGVEQAAETIGKALNIPSEGMASLSKQGFQFSEDQKKLAERLQASGKTAEAQGIILNELSSSYGGAAKAARDTFGGALIGLQNQLNSLITGSDGSLKGATDAVNELARTLASPEVKQAFDSLTTLLANVIRLLASATGEFVNFGKFVGESIAKAVHGSADPIERLDDQLVGLRTELVALDKELARPRKFSAGNGYDGVDQLSSRAAALRKEIAGIEKSRADFVRMANNPMAPAKVAGAPLPKPPAIQTSGANKAAAEALKIALNAQLKEWERFISEQQDLLQERNKFLDLYNGLGLLSIKEYYDQQKSILDEATEAQVKAYDAQVKALQDYISKAPKDADRANAQEKVNDLLAKQAKLQRDAGSAAIEAGFKQQKAAEDALKAYRDVNAQLLELQGRVGEAARIRLGDQFESVEKLARANGRDDVLGQIDEIKRLGAAQADLNKLSNEYRFIQESLGIQTDRIALAQQMGTDGELQGLVKLGEARRASFEQLKGIADEYERIAQASGDPNMILGAERLRLELEELGATLDPLADKINTMLGDGFADAFSSILDGTKSAKEAFKDMINSIMRDLMRMAVQDTFKKLFSGATGSGFDIGSLISGMFGGARANGGPTAPNTLYRVNERGPELFNVGGAQFLMTGSQGGSVTPNHQLGGASTNNFYVTVPQQTSRATGAQIAAEAARKLEMARRNM